jgi:RNA polymerase sigma factor (sigma-70 family)
VAGTTKRGRKLKFDLGTVDAATARQLLIDHARDVRLLVRQYNWLNATDLDELKSTATLAVLEGHLTYNGKGTKEGWIRTVIRWRVREAATDATHQEELLTANPPERMNGADPEQQFWRSTAVRALGHLSPRHRIIVDGHMRGETFEEIGASIGLSTQRTHAESQKAFTKLRRVLGIEEPEKSK